jgi:hypothetical protein
MVINYLHRNFNYVDDIGIGFVYFNYKVPMSVSELLGSLLKQLVMQKATLSREIRNAYQAHTENGTQPTIDTLSRLLQAESRDLSAAYLVLDGLDEFTTGVNDVGYRILFREFQKLGSALRFLITSRPSHPFMTSIPIAAPYLTRLEIRAIEDDIQKYVLTCLREQDIDLDPNLLNFVPRRIAELSQGM